LRPSARPNSPQEKKSKAAAVNPNAGTITCEATQLNACVDTIACACSGLISELVDVFNIVEVGGRPPIGGKAGTKGDWIIGDLVLPVPGDFRRTCFHIPFFLSSFLTGNAQGTLPTI
jgi:hypothetical protein